MNARRSSATAGSWLGCVAVSMMLMVPLVISPAPSQAAKATPGSRAAARGPGASAGARGPGARVAPARARAVEPGYHDFASLSRELDRLASSGGRIARKVSLGRTLQGRDIWVLALGADAARLEGPSGHIGEIREDGATHAALFVAGGVDATQLAGSEEALRFAARLVSDYGRVDSVTTLLDHATIYIAPRVSPDACERFFQTPLFEATTNFTSVDDDHDGRVDEDGPEDLNGDGLITWMRVEDPEGEWLPDPRDPRLMKRADPAKGEVGRYKVYLEGRDSDRDERWNEDPPGGVDFSHSWPYGYRYFAPGAGVDPMTERENRAVADFLFDHASIAAVFVFGAQDNLARPWKSDPGNAAAVDRALSAGRRGAFGRGYGGGTGGLSSTPATGGGGRASRGPDAPAMDPVISSPPAGDAAVYDFISRQYLRITGFKDAPDPAPAQGDLGSYAYYDFGRWAFTARPWWPSSPAGSASAAESASAPESAPPASPRAGRGRRGGGGGPGSPAGAGSSAGAAPGAASGKGFGGAGAGAGASESQEDADFKDLRALEASHIDGLIPVQAVQHPDFPGRKVEVFGFRPYVRTVPPAALLDSLSDRTSAFLLDLTARLPRLAIRDARAVSLGRGAARVTADVVDTGYLPSNPQMGQIARWPRNVRVMVRAGEGQKLLSGFPLQVLDPIAGSGGYTQLSWVVAGPSGSRLTLTADSPTSGTASAQVVLP